MVGTSNHFLEPFSCNLHFPRFFNHSHSFKTTLQTINMKSTFFALAAIATSTFAAPICYDPDVQVAGSNSTVPSTTASSTVIESTASPSADAEEAPAAPAAGQSSSEGPIGYASLNGG